MKIIGKVDHDTYLAEVTHTELEKLANKYYGRMDRLEVGEQVNLGAGYDFRKDITDACRSMVEAMGRFERARDSLLGFAQMVMDRCEDAPAGDDAEGA